MLAHSGHLAMRFYTSHLALVLSEQHSHWPAYTLIKYLLDVIGWALQTGGSGQQCIYRPGYLILV